jgi:16S rRNA (guanine527-N7)-methyltransferase
MGQFPDPKAAIALEQALETLGLKPSPDSFERLLDYAEELVHWSRRIDLTGATSTAELVAGPLFDALTLVPVLDDRPTLVDVGTGGGLPSVPAAILIPALRVTLVEPRSRKTAFLRHVLHALRLDAEVVQCRDEELRDAEWDGAVSQATWPVAEWLERGPRLVLPGGALYSLTVDPLDPRALPDGAAVELERAFNRPRDGAPRIATRLRCR